MIWTITDTHHGAHRKIDVSQNIDKLSFYKTGDYWFNSIKSFYYDWFLPILKERFNKQHDILIHLGDVFDISKGEWMNIQDISFTLQLYKDVLEIIDSEIYILVGNHDMFSNFNLDIHAIKYLGEISDKIKIIDKPTERLIFNKQCLLLPYYRDAYILKKILNEYKKDYLFLHGDLYGAKLTNNDNNILIKGINLEDVKNYEYVYSGHIHIKQKIKNWEYLGTPYHLDLNDKGTEKGIHIINPENNRLEFIENQYSPKFIDLVIDSKDDFNKLIKNKGNLLDLKINQKLLLEDSEIKSMYREIIKEVNPYRSEYINVERRKREHNNVEIEFTNISNNSYQNIMNIFEKVFEDDNKDEIRNELNNIIETHKNK